MFLKLGTLITPEQTVHCVIHPGKKWEHYQKKKKGKKVLFYVLLVKVKHKPMSHKYGGQKWEWQHSVGTSSSSSSSIPSLRGSLGHHRWFHSQFSPSFPVLHCPMGLAELQACPFFNVVFPPLPLPALSSSPFHCALQDGFGQTWWKGDMTIPLQFASL